MKHNILVSWEGTTAKGAIHREMIVIQEENFNVEEYRKRLMRDFLLNQCVIKKFSDLGEVRPEAYLDKDPTDPQMDIEVEAKKKKVIRRTPKAEA